MPTNPEMHQLLGPDGTLVGEVPEGLDEDTLTTMMRLGRQIDHKAIALQRRGKLGTYAPLSGQEAASVGSSFAMDPDVDHLVPQDREQLTMIHWGLPLGTYLLQRYGPPPGLCCPTTAGCTPSRSPWPLTCPTPSAWPGACGCVACRQRSSATSATAPAARATPTRR